MACGSFEKCWALCRTELPHGMLKTELYTLVISEVFRWILIVVPLYLCIWQYTKYRGFTVFVSGADEEVQFWCVVSAIIVASSLLVYLPVKLVVLRFRMILNKLRDQTWRPSIVLYIMGCALPCLTLVLVAVKDPVIQEEGDTTVSPCHKGDTLDPETATILQVVVFGLTITEWISKLSEEVVTYDLITAMAIDFFFAYDVIAFIMMPAYEPDVFNSEWIYVCFVFAWVAMYKYVPTQPISICENGAPKGAATSILVTMICNDIPFVVVRLSTLFIFGFQASDFIHPVKNIGMICFGAIQLFFIHRNAKDERTNRDLRYSEKRILKRPGAWCQTADGKVSPTPGPEIDDDVISLHTRSSQETASDGKLKGKKRPVGGNGEDTGNDVAVDDIE